jgi:hypothetical protein
MRNICQTWLRCAVLFGVASTSLLLAGSREVQVAHSMNNPTANATTRQSCAVGGLCKLGEIGPGGGVVFHDAGRMQWWGRYLEARVLTNGRGLPWSPGTPRSLYVHEDPSMVRRMRMDAKAIGMGKVNTDAIVSDHGSGRYAAKFISDLVAGGKDDWHLPSKDELNALYTYRAKTSRPRMDTGPYWTSTEASRGYAWYQMFQDGTMFTDEYGVGRIDSNKNTRRQPTHIGSSFPSERYRLVAVRAFPKGTGVVPPVTDPKLTGKTCSEQGPCEVGDIGPAGGVIFYDAGRAKTWGRYLEAAPASVEIGGLPWKKLSVNDRSRPVYRNTATTSARLARVISKEIGMGMANTKAIVSTYRKGRYAARYAHNLVVNGYDDWFLPSADELDVMYNVLQTSRHKMDIFVLRFYWSSSEYDFNNAWTQSMRAGQQFDREKWLRSPRDILWVRPIRAFGAK